MSIVENERELDDFNSYVHCDSKPEGWPVLREEALYGLPGEIVRLIEPHTESDPAAILLQFLVTFGNCVGPGPCYYVEATRHGLNMFALLVGETAKARKGTSWRQVKRLFDGVDPDWINDRVMGGLSSAEGLIAEVRDDGEPPPDRRLLIVQDEFASVLRAMPREGNTLSPLLRSAWDGGTLRTLVKRDPLKATGAHISVIGHITRPELLRYLNDTEQHNGFANRLLFSCVRRSKCLPEGGSVPQSVIVDLTEKIQGAVAWTTANQRELRRDESARELWAAVYPHLSDGVPGLLGTATSRAEAQVLRLSGLYAVLDQSAVIRVEHLRAAFALWDFCFGSARFIFGDSTGEPVAERIRSALNEAASQGMTRTQIRDLFKRHASSHQVEQALSMLAKLGVAVRSKVGSEGRSTELWFATKAI